MLGVFLCRGLIIIIDRRRRLTPPTALYPMVAATERAESRPRHFHSDRPCCRNMALVFELDGWQQAKARLVILIGHNGGSLDLT